MVDGFCFKFRCKAAKRAGLGALRSGPAMGTRMASACNALQLQVSLRPALNRASGRDPWPAPRIGGRSASVFRAAPGSARPRPRHGIAQHIFGSVPPARAATALAPGCSGHRLPLTRHCPGSVRQPSCTANRATTPGEKSFLVRRGSGARCRARLLVIALAAAYVAYSARGQGGIGAARPAHSADHFRRHRRL